MTAANGSTWTILVAAGRGSRFGGATPKQFVEIAGRRIVDWSLLTACAASDGVVVVVPEAGGHDPIGPVDDTPVVTVPGGATRSASVRSGLDGLPADAEVVLVHDAARPLASVELYRRVAGAVLDGADGAVPTVAVVDTLRDVDGDPVDRSRFEAVQTPQGFKVDALRSAHGQGGDATDDATLVTINGGQVVTVPGERWNLKVTDPTDELVVAALLQADR